MKTRFIVNPHSGATHRALPALERFATKHGAEIVFTARPRHATELAERAGAEHCELIVAVGGDGTLNEVARGVLRTDSVLGLVPCGSGNGLGRHLGIHGSVPHALGILRSGLVRRIDTGWVEGIPFFTVAGLGFEAEISDRFNRLNHRGFSRYLMTAAQMFAAFKPFECRIEHAGNSEQVRVFTLAVANSDQYGNNAHIAPSARIDDGLLDLTVVPPVGFFNAVPLLARLFTGTLRTGVTHRQADRFVIERNAPGLVHTDGETHMLGPRIEFTVKPRSLPILVPAIRATL